MAKRKKTRTHKLNPKATVISQSPKSFVIKSNRGHHGQSSANGPTGGGYSCTSLNLLVKDFRKVMEPNTASHLKERKSNRFKDFLAMAGPLGVTHMIVFSQSLPSKPTSTTKDEEIISSINMKIYKVPRGPTLSFKVLRYSLMHDILNCVKNPRSPGQEFKTEPLLIMNNFNPSPSATAEEGNQLNLLTTTFRNLFPQIKVHEVQLVQTRRIVLLSYNPVTKTIDFRHYLITVKPVGVSKKIRTLIEGALVNNRQDESEAQKGKKKMRRILDLSGIEDVSQYVLGKIKIRAPGSSTSSAGFTAARSEGTATEIGEQSDYDGISSGGEEESENEANQRKIELPQNYLGKGNIKNSKKSVKLRELGPRMELGLVKIEQGLGNGDVLFHEFIKKTKQEDLAIKQAVKEKAKLRQARKAEQEANVKKKRLALEQQKQAKAAKREDKQRVESSAQAGGSAEDGAGDNIEEEDAQEEESEIDQEAEYSDLFDDEEEMEGASSDSREDTDLSDMEPEPAQPLGSRIHTKKKVKFMKGQ